MPLTQSLPDLRREIQDLLTEDLAAALTALRAFLPENSDKHGQVLALRARLNDANKERYRNTLSPDDYQRRVDTIRAECFDLLNGLEEVDFEQPGDKSTSAKVSAGKQGSILYRVPRQMPLRKPSICTIRVAIDEDAILEDIVLDADVRVRPRVEVSDMMRAELLDPEGEVFSIRPLSEKEQLVREQGYTQWLFSVTPQAEGEHQLLVKVSMMEYNTQLGRYVPREVSVLETVTIVTETAVSELDESPLKSTGEQIAIGPETLATRRLEQVAPAPEANASAAASDEVKSSGTDIPPPLPVVAPAQTGSEPAPQAKHRPSSVRAMAVFLVVLMAGSSATWALTPPPTRSWWVTSIRDSEEAYAEYKEKFKDDPRAVAKVETATFRIAEKTGELADLRAYLGAYGVKGRYVDQAVKRVEALEVQDIQQILQQPEAKRILQFVQDYPESQRLSELIKAAKSRPEVLRAVQPELEDAYWKKIGPEPTETKLEEFLEQFPEPMQRQQLEQILEQNPRLKNRVKTRLDHLPAQDQQQESNRPTRRKKPGSLE